MSGAGTRVFLDCTHTRLQGAEVGITRVVRGLARGLAACGEDVRPVAWHRDGFRVAPSVEPETAAGTGAGGHGATAGLYRLSGEPWVRRLAKRLTPPALQVAAWRRFGRRAFSTFSEALPAAGIGAGDLLVAADAGWNYDLWPAARHAREAGARVVTVVYDLIPANQPQYCAPAHRRLFAGWLSGALAESDALLCISEATRSDVEAHCRRLGLRCPPSAAFRLGSDLPRAASAGDAAARPALRDLPTGGFFLTVGSLEPRKNHDLALDAFEALWRDGLAAPLVVVGRPVDGAQRTVARLRAHPELGRRLLLLEDCGDAELEFLYGRARAVVLPSLAEGFGLPLAEARQRGCEVIASRLPAFEEIADAGVRMFAPGNREELAARVRESASSPPASLPATKSVSWTESARQFLDGIARTAPTRTT